MIDNYKTKRTDKECKQAYSPLKKSRILPIQESLHNDSLVNTFLLSTSSTRFASICPADCCAVRLAEFIIVTVQENIFPIDGDGRFSEGFYRLCMSRADECGLSEEIGDRDLVEIYLKQTVVMLRAAGILENDKRIARITEQDLSRHRLYSLLFQAFWNDVGWEDIFPSDKEMAVELKRNRYFLADLILKQSIVQLGSIANEFFELTGFSGRNDLFAISFLDFYFFTWLKNFGIIRYLESDCSAPVSIQVTERGRKFMKLTV